MPSWRSSTASLEVLTEVGAESDTHRRRLFSLEADIEAFRRLIGTAPAEVTP